MVDRSLTRDLSVLYMKLYMSLKKKMLLIIKIFAGFLKWGYLLVIIHIERISNEINHRLIGVLP